MVQPWNINWADSVIKALCDHTPHSLCSKEGLTIAGPQRLCLICSKTLATPFKYSWCVFSLEQPEFCIWEATPPGLMQNRDPPPCCPETPRVSQGSRDRLGSRGPQRVGSRHASERRSLESTPGNFSAKVLVLLPCFLCRFEHAELKLS